MIDPKKGGFAGQMAVKAVNGFNGFWNVVTTKGPVGAFGSFMNGVFKDLLDCEGDYEELLQQLDACFGDVTQTVFGVPKRMAALMFLGAVGGGLGNIELSDGEAGSAGGGSYGGGSGGGGNGGQTSDQFDDGTLDDDGSNSRNDYLPPNATFNTR
jgi:hypothetical protein